MLLGRIAQLEKTRTEMLAVAAERGDNPGDKAREIAVALRAMVEVETSQPEASEEDDELG
jgi:hypothetical protein